MFRKAADVTGEGATVSESEDCEDEAVEDGADVGRFTSELVAAAPAAVLVRLDDAAASDAACEFDLFAGAVVGVVVPLRVDEGAAPPIGGIGFSAWVVDAYSVSCFTELVLAARLS